MQYVIIYVSLYPRTGKTRISKKIIFLRCYEDSLKMSRKLDASYWYCYMLLLYVFF